MNLTSPAKLKSTLPLPSESATRISRFRQTGMNLLARNDARHLVVAGPCSIHNREEALEYARRYKELAREVEESLFLIMRLYVEKPRTALGWKGLIYDHLLDGSHDIEGGLRTARSLLVELAEMGVPVATEFVDPLLAPYFSDLITWGFIGARTSASQPHRQLVSSLTFPVGFKNSTEGSCEEALNGIQTARAPHTFVQMNEEGQAGITQSNGNLHTHLVLRGSNTQSNYDPEAIEAAVAGSKRKGIHTPLLVDCAHGNCQKEHHLQCDAFESVRAQIQNGNKHILGWMLESNLREGNQVVSDSLEYGVSITDSCIGWPSTEELVLSATSIKLTHS